ncbi:uncharacterized protein C8R40DRAFT_1117482 [Lentinula edodes]|uniref:uncharacterized protein n=1 Tax=Lentinula edodes TaxID=5353 RepID=UPI001E8D7F7F|nr:uncharacterized protein C8R40DRAFT_1117482 [Lentinula edodes]KAH7872270.1 hypothetical protein C8R40DRAFT_1117482 [Lentinula edodes]
MLTLIKFISQQCNHFLQSEINSSSHLALLQGCCESLETAKYQPRTLRIYLARVLKPNHRLTLTNSLYRDMVPLAFRASTRILPLEPADRSMKQCRAYSSSYHPESPQHVLQCTSVPGLNTLREQFLNNIATLIALPSSRSFFNEFWLGTGPPPNRCQSTLFRTTTENLEPKASEELSMSSAHTQAYMQAKDQTFLRSMALRTFFRSPHICSLVPSPVKIIVWPSIESSTSFLCYPHCYIYNSRL